MYFVFISRVKGATPTAATTTTTTTTTATTTMRLKNCFLSATEIDFSRKLYSIKQNIISY